MKLYLSGPMSGKPAFNIPKFDAYAKALRSLGHEVVSPAELDDPAFRDLCLLCHTGSMDELRDLCHAVKIEPDSWGDLLARDVKLLADDGIEGIVVMDEWEDSRGALLETYVGRLCSLGIYEFDLKRGGPLRAIDAYTLMQTHARAAGHIHQDNKHGKLQPIHECGIKSGEPESCDCKHPNECTTRADIPQHVPLPSSGEVRVTSETGGQKGSKNAVLGDICPKALKLLAEVAGFGRTKYSRLNYLKGFDYSLAYDAAIRHLNEFWQGNDVDEESGLPHLAHAAWQCLCLLAFCLRGVGKDDRP